MNEYFICLKKNHTKHAVTFYFFGMHALIYGTKLLLCKLKLLNFSTL